MPLTCNIDSRGKVARLLWGILLLAIGAGLIVFWAWGSGSWIRWGVTAAVIVSGAFMIFEARAGWCAVRAMGIKTPM